MVDPLSELIRRFLLSSAVLFESLLGSGAFLLHQSRIDLAVGGGGALRVPLRSWPSFSIQLSRLAGAAGFTMVAKALLTCSFSVPPFCRH